MNIIHQNSSKQHFGEAYCNYYNCTVLHLIIDQIIFVMRHSKKLHSSSIQYTNKR